MAAALSLSDQLPCPVCPKCGASEYRKAGKNSHNKQQMLNCRKCGRSWTLDVSVDLSIIEKGLKSLRISGENLIPDGVVCKRCESPNIRLAGWFRTKAVNTRRARCLDCKKYFPAPELNDIETLAPNFKHQKKIEPDICPRCGGKQIGSGGSNSNGQVLAHCRTCGTRWVLHPVEKEPLPSLTCPRCAQKKDFVKGGVENGSQRYRCQKCLTIFLPDGKWIPKCPDCGSGRYRNRGFSTSKHNLPYYKCVACSRHYSQRSRPKIESNPYVLDARSLGVDLGHYQSYKISFSHIRPSWLRDAILQYTKLKLGQGQWKFQTAKSNVSAVAVFGEYLEEHYSGLSCHELTRKILVEVMTSDWWITWCDSTKKRFLGTLADLYEAIEKYHWNEVSGDRLVFQEDYPRSSKIKARNIPESVMDQIIAKISSLPIPFQRAILVLAEVGMRFSELSSLKRGCIEQDVSGNWWLTYYQFKMDKGHRVPISKDCAFIIQEQTKFSQELFGDEFGLVFFGRSSGQTWRRKQLQNQPFNKAIQRWAKDSDIRGPDGKIWHLTTHQFRHTVATRMINAGVAQHYVQKYLGHETSQMTQHYAHLHDKTLRDAFDKYHDGQVVDIKGVIHEPTDRDVDSSDLQWFRSNIQAQALPNGSCSLPTVA